MHHPEFCLDSDIDLLVVTETWLRGDESDDYCTREICPRSFSFYHLPRLDSNGGGVGVLVKNHFKVEQSVTGPQYASFEYMELQLRSDGIPVRLVVVYRPPGLSCSLFLNEFAGYLAHLATSSGHLLLTGDFNLHVNSSDDRMSQ